jgi:hypothetical protein
MFEFDVQRTIKAAPDRVWSVLVDGKMLASAPFGITRLEGEIVAGAKLKLWSSVAPNRAFPLTVTDVQPNRTMTWRGGMPLGLFTGTRTFTLVPDGRSTQFRMREVYDGPLAGLIRKSMPDLNPSFIQFADALATAAEAMP